MKIIDWERKGNLVRFYLGADDLKDWYGDDWDDAPWEHNAGTVYPEFVSAVKDIAFPFDYDIFEPECNDFNCCKDAFKNGKVPFIVIIPLDIDGWICNYTEAIAIKNSVTYCMGDKMEPTKDGSIEVFNVHIY